MTVYGRCSLDTLIEAYKRHQPRVRGLREKTLHGYERPSYVFSPKQPSATALSISHASVPST